MDPVDAYAAMNLVNDKSTAERAARNSTTALLVYRNLSALLIR
jgi:hypothetical protein